MCPPAHTPHFCVAAAPLFTFVAGRYINGVQISTPQCNTPMAYFNIKARITQDLYVRGKNVVSIVVYDADSACADISSWSFIAVSSLNEARMLWVKLRENSRLFFVHWRQLSLQYLQVFSRASDMDFSESRPAPTFVIVTEWLPLLDATADQSQSHHMWAMAASAGIRTVVIARDCEGSYRSFLGGIQNRSAVQVSDELPQLSAHRAGRVRQRPLQRAARVAGHARRSHIECEQAMELAA